MKIACEYPTPATLAQQRSGFTLERRTIGPIPEDERFGRARELFGIWFGMNMSPLTIVTGALATTTLRLSIGWAVLAILVGHAIGGLAMALHAAQGPRLGVPQLLQARGQFGMYGAAIIALIAVANFIGFFASNLIVIVDALSTITRIGDGRWVIVAATIVSLVASTFGYKILRWVTVAAAVVVGLLVAFAFGWILLTAQLDAMWATGNDLNTSGFLSMIAIGAMWQISYAPYVSDYSRYMPRDTGARASFWASYAGCVSSAVLLMVLGAVIGAITNATNTLVALASLVGAAAPVMMLGFAIATAAYNSVNTYCSALCALSVAQTFRPRWTPRLASRVVMTILVHAIGLTLALLAKDNFVAYFSDFITWVLYVMIPWSAINLVDYYLVRHGDYAVDEFFRPDGGRYGKWNIRAIFVYVVGLAFEIPFISTSTFHGFLNHALGGVDVAWVFGFLVCGLAYYGVASRVRAEVPCGTA